MKKERTIIAVDCGFDNLKAQSKEEELLYANKFSLIETDENLLGENTFNVIYEDKKYTLGQNASNGLIGEGKNTVQHKISTLVAIANLLDVEEDNDDIHLMYGESITPYFNEDQRTEIKKLLEGYHEIVVDGVLYEFRITYVHVLPEGIGHIISDLEKYAGIQYVVDIGGSTMNILTVINGRPIQEQSISLKLGMNNIVAKIKKTLKEKRFGTYNNMLIENLIDKGCNNKQVQEVIDDTIEKQLTILDEEMDDLGLSIHDLLKVHNFTFVGGGSMALREKIESRYKGVTVLDNSIMCNVGGYYMYGVAKFGNLPKTKTKKLKERK